MYCRKNMLRYLQCVFRTYIVLEMLVPILNMKAYSKAAVPNLSGSMDQKWWLWGDGISHVCATCTNGALGAHPLTN